MSTRHQNGNDNSGKSAPSARNFRANLRMIVITVAVLVLIFGGYEIIERTWLAGKSLRVIHFLHIIRGIGATVIVALLSWWCIFRFAPPIFPVQGLEERSLPDESRRSVSEAVCFGRWFIIMRWIACIVSAILVIAAIPVLHYLEEEAFAPLMLLILCLAGSNVVYGLFLGLGVFPKAILEIQIYADLLILTALLHFSGGIENPMIFAYTFHVIIAGILLTPRKCCTVMLTAAALFALMAFAEMGGLVNHSTLFVFPHPEIRAQSEDRHKAGSHHAAGSEDGLFHAAHQPLYVASVVGMQFVFFALTAYFTISVMAQLRAEENRAQAEQQRLEKEILEISSREQQRVGQDLHDGLCQQLGGIAFMSQVLEEKLGKKAIEEAPDAARICNLLSQAVSATRNLSKGLCPVPRAADGLRLALKELAAFTENLFATLCSFRCDDQVLIRDNAAATHLYRIAQEAINNAVKHGAAKHILIALSVADGDLILRIKDDGRGLPETADTSKGMGLKIMNYRAGMIGARVAIKRDSDGGTSVTVRGRYADVQETQGPRQGENSHC